MKRSISTLGEHLNRLGRRCSNGPQRCKQRLRRPLRCEPLEDRMLLSLYYVNAVGGSDSYNGLAAAHTSGTTGPWQTLTKVNNSTSKTNPGDSVLFKRGDVWHGQLTTDNGSSAGRITYGAYGDPAAAKPLILGSTAEDSTSNWANVGTNLWQTTATIDPSADAGNVIYNNGQSCGVKYTSSGSLASQGDWYENSSRYVTIYSASNPASYYSSGGVEIALTRNIVQGGSYVTMQNLDLRYGGFHGMDFENKHDITVANCDLSFMGGVYSGSSRMGNAIQFYGSVSYILVEGCNIWDIYDAGISNQYYGSATVSEHDIVYRNNIIGNCEYALEAVAQLRDDDVQHFLGAEHLP